ncbi:MAG: FAD-dependent oxidoreductase, partial [Planctomycetaceae bacterium]
MLRFLVFLSVLLLELPNGCVSCWAEDFAVETEKVVADLLIVGGTESGCAAAVQAARMGIPRIVVVSDTHLLGGQFTAEGLLAIDENRGPEGYGHGVPFPRHGLFRDLIERIEAINVQREGKARPGNTRVITTCRPSVSQEAFTALLRPYLDSGRVQVRTDWHPRSCLFGHEEASERRQV